MRVTGKIFKSYDECMNWCKETEQAKKKSFSRTFSTSKLVVYYHIPELINKGTYNIMITKSKELPPEIKYDEGDKKTYKLSNNAYLHEASPVEDGYYKAEFDNKKDAVKFMKDKLGPKLLELA